MRVMHVKDILSQLEKSSAFESWRKQNPHAYLAHLFCMIEKGGMSWQAGYYDKDADAITSFDIGDAVTMHPPEEIFKKEGAKVKELVRDNITIDLEQALDTAKELQQRKYPAEMPLKIIVVLQTLSVGQVYNITYVTKGFKTLNMKISTETGKVVDEQLAPIFSFEKGDRKAT